MTPDWIKTAKVGDKVVCVRNTHQVINYKGYPPFTEGEVLTIREIMLSDANGALWDNQPFLSFEEKHPLQYGHWKGFRPVEPRKTDISWAHDILKKASRPVEEHV